MYKIIRTGFSEEAVFDLKLKKASGRRRPGCSKMGGSLEHWNERREVGVLGEQGCNVQDEAGATAGATSGGPGRPG